MALGLRMVLTISSHPTVWPRTPFRGPSAAQKHGREKQSVAFGRRNQGKKSLSFCPGTSVVRAGAEKEIVMAALGLHRWLSRLKRRTKKGLDGSSPDAERRLKRWCYRP